MDSSSRLELWAGYECSIVRIKDSFRNLIAETGHDRRSQDLSDLNGLGVKKVRYPVLWETIAPERPEVSEWTWHDERLKQLREFNIEPILGLLHHGSGPHYTNLLDPHFSELFAEHAYNVARRYPWISLFTPVNEPLTTARFSCLYGHWYPHRKDTGAFLHALVNQCKAIALAMRAIRRVTPGARLIQTEDLGKVFSTPQLSYQAEYENERRWLSLDLLCGRVTREHPWHETLLSHGVDQRDLALFLEEDHGPNVIGINHYVTSERYLDGDMHAYPAHSHGGNHKQRYADVEAVRIDLPSHQLGMKARLSEASARYRLPVAATEVHLGCTREDQLRWLSEAWTAAQELRATGHDITALTVWALLGSLDWSSLLTARRDHYEPGPFDLRADRPRQTALASATRSLATTGRYNHPVLDGQGWWRRDDRYYVPRGPDCRDRAGECARLLIIRSGTGVLSQLLADICELRDLAWAFLHDGPDAPDAALLDRRIVEQRGWAVINVDPPLTPSASSLGNIAQVAQRFASACSRLGIPIVQFSSDLVFDGTLDRFYLEVDGAFPVCRRGRDLLAAETAVQAACREALIVRTGPIFGMPGEISLDAVYECQLDRQEQQVTISPAYAPDLLNAAIDLLIDEERGIWHLSNKGEMTLSEFTNCVGAVQQIAIDTRLASRREARVANFTLASGRGHVMPSLDDAMARYLTEAHRIRSSGLRMAAE